MVRWLSVRCVYGLAVRKNALREGGNKDSYSMNPTNAMNSVNSKIIFIEDSKNYNKNNINYYYLKLGKSHLNVIIL